MGKVVLYIKTHWEGKQPLPISYGINFLAVVLIFRFLTAIAFNNIEWNGIGSKIFLTYMLTFLLALSIWGTFGALSCLWKRIASFKVIALYFVMFLVTAHTYRFLQNIASVIFHA